MLTPPHILVDLCESGFNQSIGISHLIKEDWTKVLVELVSEAIVTNIWRNTCGLILSTQVSFFFSLKVEHIAGKEH